MAIAKFYLDNGMSAESSFDSNKVDVQNLIFESRLHGNMLKIVGVDDSPMILLDADKIVMVKIEDYEEAN